MIRKTERGKFPQNAALPPADSIMARWKHQPHYSFTDVTYLGNGAFGSTFKAYSSIHGQFVAVKRIQKFKLRMSREILMLATIQSPEVPLCSNVIRMMGFQYETSQTLKGKLQSTKSCKFRSHQKGSLTAQCKITQNIILELHPRTLDHFIFSNRNPITEKEIRRIVRGTLNGLAHLEQLGIAHRDMKPENILLDEHQNPVINDFGSAKRLTLCAQGLPPQLRHDTLMMTAIPYRAPEMCLGIKHYSTKVDIWSTGCIFTELLTRRLLFSTNKEGEQILRYFEIIGPLEGKDLKEMSEKMGSKSQIFQAQALQPDPTGLRKEIRRRMKNVEISLDGLEDFLDVIEEMLRVNPSRRISASEALKMPFCQDK